MECMPATAKKKKDPAAVALGRKGGKKGGLARAAKLTPEQRSESARKAVQARWAKTKTKDSDYIVSKGDKDGVRAFAEFQIDEATPAIDTSKKALYACLKRIKETNDENELLRLAEQLQRIVFRRQYQNAKA